MAIPARQIPGTILSHLHYIKLKTGFMVSTVLLEDDFIRNLMIIRLATYSHLDCYPNSNLCCSEWHIMLFATPVFIQSHLVCLQAYGNVFQKETDV